MKGKIMSIENNKGGTREPLPSPSSEVAIDCSSKEMIKLWNSIGKVQAKLVPFIPKGTMTIGGKNIPYVTKNQIISELSRLMSEEKLLCSYEKIAKIDVVKQYNIYKNSAGKIMEIPSIHLRYWVEYAVRSLETGAIVYRIITSDAMGSDSKHSTTALAIALRDFLSQMFLVSADPNVISLEEIQVNGVDEVTRKLSMEDIQEGIKKKAQFLVQKVGMGPLQKKAKSIAFKPSSWDLDEMNHEDLWRLIEVGLEMISPSTEKESLRTVIKEKSNAT